MYTYDTWATDQNQDKRIAAPSSEGRRVHPTASYVPLATAGPPVHRLGEMRSGPYAANHHPGAGGQPAPKPSTNVVPAPVPPAKSPTAPSAGALAWSHLLTFTNDALWYFRGEDPSGFSTSAALGATGFSNSALLTWRIKQGADKVTFAGPAAGSQVRVRSTAGSAKANDVAIELQEKSGTQTRSFTGYLTVRKPHRLILLNTSTQAACPTWAHCKPGCTAYWTQFKYRVMDNTGGMIVGATVNESFPSAKADDQLNNWPSPAAFVTISYWDNTNGTFIDNWFIGCGSPAPAAGTPDAGQSVDRIQHEFYVGSKVTGKGCIVQRHTAHRYRGFAAHENIVSPVP